MPAPTARRSRADAPADACAAADAATGLYVFSPSGAVPADGRLEHARANLARAGFAVRLDRSALAQHQRFAGSDAVRLASFARAAAAREPLAMITRGGYGLTRLLPQLDYARLADSGKQWIGLSDFTAFHLAMLARAGATTWAGPALLEDFGRERFEDIDETTLGTFQDAVAGRLEVLGFRMAGPSGVDARGVLWGGNLALVCALLGTPYFPQVKGGILFVEDVNEHPFRVERMLTQLLHAGVIDRQKAVLFGYFNGYRLYDNDRGFDMPAVLRWLRSRTRTPIVTGLPFGHGSPKLMLPHGAKVGFATEGRTAYLVLPHGHAHRAPAIDAPDAAPLVPHRH
jgi:muramoyltetrapeptide carboxypeptidase